MANSKIIVAKRAAVEVLLADAQRYVDYCKEYIPDAAEQARGIVERISLATSVKEHLEHVQVDSSDLSALYDLAQAHNRIQGQSWIKLVQSHAVASWLAATPTVVMGFWTQPAESLLLLASAPLISAFFLYVYLPLRLATYSLAWIASLFRSNIEPRFVESDDYGLIFAVLIAVRFVPLMIPSWFIVRQLRTGRKKRWPWIVAGMILLADFAWLAFRH